MSEPTKQQSEEASVAMEQNEISPAPKKRKQPVVIYMVILVIAVIAMLGVSYGMQLRSNQRLDSLSQTVSGLEDSYTALEKLNELQATIDTQSGQIRDLEDQLEGAQSVKTQMEDEEAALRADLDTRDKAVKALSYLVSLQVAYETNDLTLCQSIIDAMEANDLVQYLSDTPILDSSVSPKEQYTAIATDAASIANAGEEDGAENTTPAESATPAN